MRQALFNIIYGLAILYLIVRADVVSVCFRNEIIRIDRFLEHVSIEDVAGAGDYRYVEIAQ